MSHTNTLMTVSQIVIGLLWNGMGSDVRAALETASARGVVVEEIGKRSVLAKAGLEPGDVLLTWRRLPAPPANPEEVRGEFLSAFDWMWLEIEQAPRGTVEFIGWSGEEPRVFKVSPGYWEAKIRPWMAADLLTDYVLAQEFLDAGNVARATRLWEKVDTATKDWRLRCWLLRRVGKVWAEQGQWETALEKYRRAIAEARKPFPKSVIWHAIGHGHRERGEFELARQAYKSAWEIRESHWRNSLVLADSLNFVGAVKFRLGDLEGVERSWKRSWEIRQGLAPYSLSTAAALNNMGVLALTRGDLSPATHYFQRALVLWQDLNPHSIDRKRPLHNLGAVAYARGELAQAMDYYQRALEIQRRLEPDSADVAVILNNLGLLAAKRGYLDRATDFHQQSLKIRQAALDTSQIAYSLANLGEVATKRHELSQATDDYHRALQIFIKLAPGSLQVASILSNLGSVAHLQGETSRANGFYQRALTINMNLAPESLLVANSLNNLGYLAWGAGDLERATEFHHRALKIRERLAPGSLEMAMSLSNLGAVAEERQDLNEAIAYFQRTLEIQDRLAPGSIEVTNTLHRLGILHRQRNPPQLEVASHFLHRALDTLDNQLTQLGGSHDVRASFRTRYDEYYRNAFEVQLELGQQDTAFQTLERSRARSFLEHLAERDIVFAADIPRELDRERRRLTARIDRTYQQFADLNTLDHEKQLTELFKQVSDLRDEARSIEDKIRRASPRLAMLQYPQPLDIQAARAALDPGTLMLSFSVGETSTVLLAVSRKQILLFDTLEVSEEILRGQVQMFLKQIRYARRPGSQRIRKFEELARSLYATLIEPAARRIEASERILILADGPLHYLPWGALLRDTPDGAQYMVEWKPFHLALSATVYAELRKLRRRGKESLPPVQVAAFGNPSYPGNRENTARHNDVIVRFAAERTLFDWEPLPYTRREVEAIADVFPAKHVRVYMGEDATEERAKSLGRGLRILHFATHSHLDERFPLNSFLALTIPEKYREGHDNGLLQAWEIFERVRIDADLVVLSACETALGEEQGGEGLIGLTRAFQYAGARTVAASLWRIADQATAELMSSFYRHLNAGATKDQALREAQLELIHGEDERLKAPYFWAAFQLYGDWQ